MLDKNLFRYSLGRGTFLSGVYGGSDYNIVILNPGDAEACHAISQAEIENEKRLSVQNVKPREKDEILYKMSFNMEPPKAQKGGLVVGLYAEEDNRLLAMGGVALIHDKNDGGRGFNFKKCPLKRQVILNMGITHPNYQSLGLTSLIFPHRLNVAQSFKHRDYVVTKVAGLKTKDFYHHKMGFEKQEREYILPGVEAPNNGLATLGKPMGEVRRYLGDHHPDILANKIDLCSLHANHKTPRIKMARAFA
ncbi:MAG: hypothetical protein JWM96_211 [Alphaproteobacteria bacterium]|nr:hypothetical protein [Alphaproteobacteria bacterium]